ncbi:MAG: sporulation protein YqfD [Eubacteriales bacterium]|nr:sporulation protein YqfD [Eubacteriales bacterium]
MNIWESITGICRVEVTSADCTALLAAVNRAGIAVSRLEGMDDLTVCFHIRRRDMKKLSSLCQRRGARLRVLGREGLYWTGLGLLRRPVLLVGLAMLMALGLYLPTRVLFIRVEGNEAVPARQILAAAEDCGVGFGASRRYVRSEKVKNALLGAIPELGWAGVNTSGCTAVISVRERTEAKQTAQALPAAIVASRDGFILSADVTQGTALFQTGQTVRRGQTLISGFTDCGICIRATGAEGEIFAQTRRELETVTPVTCLVRGQKGDLRRKISLRYRKKRINLWKDSGICDTTCGRMYREFYITLPGGFRLPIALCVEEYTCWSVEEARADRTRAEAALDSFGASYLRSQMISGQILQKQQRFSEAEGLYRLEGTYDCTEMIGRAQKIGETNGKRD